MTWMVSASGQEIDLLEPDLSKITIEDIAKHLSKIGRFSGATTGRFAYSVAEHSYYCSSIAAPPWRKATLLHDAPEAYINDVISPLKYVLYDLVKPYEVMHELPAGTLNVYKRVEKIWHRAIEEKFELQTGATESEEVVRCDRVLLATERRDLLPKHDRMWSLQLPEPLSWTLRPPLPPDEAEELFLTRFYELQPFNEEVRRGAR